MRLYLSSFRLGDHPGHLVTLAGDGGRRALVIANALDDQPDTIRRVSTGTEVRDLGQLGFDAVELDLRGYAGEPEHLRADLAGVALVWLRGGNTFMLRYALRLSGADTVLRDLLAGDVLTYGGYSAGCCVLAPSLRGLEMVDDAAAVARVYGSEPVWEGLGLIDEAIVPHYDSDHPEAAAVGLLAQHYREHAIPHRTLRDGQVLIVNGETVTLV
ncbi:MAG TPA: Type 1 glutamine amidotransferase-like domain-containing protein [Streptosporangiaceae bacterium]|nr:Type 1 glutamine amidotransferase-like domain-containing protein [Streptosporangiaceae bacterium]